MRIEPLNPGPSDVTIHLWATIRGAHKLDITLCGKWSTYKNPRIGTWEHEKVECPRCQQKMKAEDQDS